MAACSLSRKFSEHASLLRSGPVGARDQRIQRVRRTKARSRRRLGPLAFAFHHDEIRRREAIFRFANGMRGSRDELFANVGMLRALQDSEQQQRCHFLRNS